MVAWLVGRCRLERLKRVSHPFPPIPLTIMAESSRQAAARSTSGTPPPLPTEQPPLPVGAEDDDASPVDQPIDSLGENDEDEDENSADEGAEDDEADSQTGEVESEHRASGSGTVEGGTKGKGKATDDGKPAGADAESTTGDTQGWQAVWAPDQNGESTRLPHCGPD